MDVRLLTEEDYDNTLVNWWSDWGWVAPPKSTLPANGTSGIMVSKDGRDICAGFLYLTNSSMAWVEYIISDKEYKETDRHDAIRHLINVLTAMAGDKGATIAFTSLNYAPLVKHYERCGFKVSSKGCYEMVKKVS